MSSDDGHGTHVARPENRVARGTQREFRGAYLITLTPHTQNTNERYIYHPDHEVRFGTTSRVIGDCQCQSCITSY
eukprot:scaffold66238_cov43-Cyclotella_meneghiniana.AAC.5